MSTEYRNRGDGSTCTNLKELLSLAMGDPRQGPLHLLQQRLHVPDTSGGSHYVVPVTLEQAGVQFNRHYELWAQNWA